MNKWMVAGKKADFEALAQSFNISVITARLLRNRGLTDENAIRRYLNCDLEELNDPALLPDCEKAATIIAKAIRDHRKIRIVGDYDVDGICATAILVSSFLLLGAEVDFRIPHRMRDGYGINMSIIEEAREAGKELLVTCDNGIAAAAECKRAREEGMQVIVTDHHEVPVDGATGAQLLPPADACINPKIVQEGVRSYPQEGICGAVVAMKLVQQVFRTMAKEGVLPFEISGDVDSVTAFLQAFPGVLEEAALATVCDVMKLEGENRTIVKTGLRGMQATKLAGLRALIRQAGLTDQQITVYHLGFVLGPCLNASGRLDSGEKGVRLLLSTEEAESSAAADELISLNAARRQMTEEATLAAREYIEREQLEEDKVLVIYLPEVHESIAGIVAGRIKEMFLRPTIVMTKAEGGVKGSARSVEAYNMFQKLSDCADLFTRYGGHPMAAGMSMDSADKIPLLRERLNTNNSLTEEDLVNVLHLDMELPPRYLTTALISEWEILEPMGSGNPRVLFAARGIRLLRAQLLGQHKNVCKIFATDAEGTGLTLMIFRDIDRWTSFLDETFGEEPRKALFEKGATVPMEIKIVYYPDINEYRGTQTIQLVVQDYIL